MNPKRMPAELMNELFCSLPFENAFGLLAKMPNGLLARNVQKMINGIKEAIKNNKLNYADCGPKLAISEDEFIAKHSGPNGWNSVRAILPIPSFNLKGINKPIISFYFEMQILNKSNLWDFGICIGFCEQHFPLEGKCVGWMNNSIRIVDKRGIWIDGKWSAFENAIEYLNKGDYIGIGIIQQPNFSLECFGTFNGKLIGKAKLPQKFSQLELFPSISLCNDGDSIRVHFEKDKWLFKQFNRVTIKFIIQKCSYIYQTNYYFNYFFFMFGGANIFNVNEMIGGVEAYFVPPSSPPSLPQPQCFGLQEMECKMQEPRCKFTFDSYQNGYSYYSCKSSCHGLKEFECKMHSPRCLYEVTALIRAFPIYNCVPMN